jgi:hypothetical protein
MQRRSKLEQVLEHLVHEEQDKAQELLHQFIVERARSIHEELMSDEDEVLEDDDFNPDEAEGEIESEEMFDGEDLDDEGEGDEDAMDDMDDMDMEDGDGGVGGDDFEGDDGLEDKISELESELEELRKEFEELQGDGEEGEGDEDADMDMEMDDEGEESGEDELDVDMEMDDEGDEEGDEDELKEVEDYTTPQHNANRKQKQTAQYGQHKGKPMSTDVHETAEGDKGNANRVKNAGYKKADPMKTDVEDTDGPSGSHDYDTDMYAYKQAGWPGKAMSTESVDLDEEWDIFDSLDESVLDDLETVNVKMGGEQGGGKYAGNETHTDSPIPQKEPANRFRNDKNSRLSSEQDTHQGFDREDAPKHENVPKYSNVRDKSSSKLDHKEKAGDKSAMLNSDDGYGEPQTTSPIGSKGTAGNKGVRGNKE